MKGQLREEIEKIVRELIRAWLDRDDWHIDDLADVERSTPDLEAMERSINRIAIRLTNFIVRVAGIKEDS